MSRARKLGLFLEILSTMARDTRVSLKRRFRSPVNLSSKFLTEATNLVSLYPPDLKPGDPVRGENWLAGDYTLTGALVKVADTSPFEVPVANTKWVEALHGFDWLRHVCALQAPRGPRAAAFYIQDWIRRNPVRVKEAMRPHIIARRLMNWSAALPTIMPELERRDADKIRQALNQQSKFLSKCVDEENNGVQRLIGAFGLAHAGLAFSNDGKWVRLGMEIILRELRRQILADGGHVSRSPETLADILSHILALESGLSARAVQIPGSLVETRKRMQAMLGMVCHPDGGLALFNGATQRTASEIAPLLDRHSSKNVMSYAQRSGYQRLTCGKLCLLVDVGQARGGPGTETSHAAPLSLEMSHGQDRIIVNCGPNLVHGEKWHLASRGVAAHSAFGFDTDIEDPFIRSGLAARVLGHRLKPENWHVTCRRVEDATGVWLESGHEQFSASHGVRYHRRLFVDASGEDLRGEDLLMPASVKHEYRAARFHLRFHLHPQVTATLQAGGTSVLLVSRNGHGWQFRFAPQADLVLNIEESVYMGEAGIPQRCQQITIAGTLQPRDTQIKWAMRYVGRIGRRR
ncbi:MAG: hypothetical protein CBD03_02250 [Rhizobiales bacterium TMED143]|nr:hypothetical protein [Rhodobiaceae bacterium]OUV92632.1 MAG: hypothetical protein CBD03_02250 [Rhizobiales bacterium TMED143]CAI8405348.1 MAG: Uncharacterised protein [Rhodobiaceae bacterium UBA7378]